MPRALSILPFLIDSSDLSLSPSDFLSLCTLDRRQIIPSPSLYTVPACRSLCAVSIDPSNPHSLIGRRVYLGSNIYTPTSPVAICIATPPGLAGFGKVTSATRSYSSAAEEEACRWPEVLAAVLCALTG